MNPRALLLDNVHVCLKKKLIEADFHISEIPSLDNFPLPNTLSSVQAIVIRSATTLDANILKKMPSLKIIGRAGVGTDNIDLEYARRQNIVVVNSPGASTVAVAEHTFALMLSLLRNIPLAHEGTRQGKWPKKKCLGHELKGKTLGLIGAGRIGQSVMKRAQAFDMKILVFDPFQKKLPSALSVTLDELLKRSDIVSLHANAAPENQHLIGRKNLAKMKSGAFLINAARGKLIDEKALYQALKTGPLGGAALDVFENEPLKNNPLEELDNCLLTPHIAASTQEAQRRAAEDIGDQLLSFFREGQVSSRVA
jgi:D-3-phosphoglycerate dehydrogenase